MFTNETIEAAKGTQKTAIHILISVEKFPNLTSVSLPSQYVKHFAKLKTLYTNEYVTPTPNPFFCRLTLI